MVKSKTVLFKERLMVYRRLRKANSIGILNSSGFERIKNVKM
jgi:hypothetical protein